MLMLGVVTSLADHLTLRGVVEVRERRVVELQVLTAQLTQTANLLGVRGAEVVPEPVDVGVDVRVNGGRTSAVVHHARRRNGELGPVSYTHLRAHETVLDLVCRLLLEKKKQ